MPKLSDEELRSFLSRPLIAKLATIRRDGWPCVNPVWFEYDGDSIYVVARKRSSYVDNIMHDSRVSVLIDECEPPYTRVIIEGNAEIVEGPSTEGRWVEIAKRMVSRYLEPEKGMKYLEETLDQPRYLIKIKPKNIISWTPGTMATYQHWHPRYFEPGSRWYEEYMKSRKQR